MPRPTDARKGQRHRLVGTIMILFAAMLQATASCPATPAAPPSSLAGWATRVPIAAESSPPPLTIGRAARATLLPATSVILPAKPGKPAATGSSSGVFALSVPAAGRYRVALGAGAWLDVVRDGRALTSKTHSHGPACSGIRKMVDFDLQPGRHLLQIVGSPTAAIDVMIVRLR